MRVNMLLWAFLFTLIFVVRSEVEVRESRIVSTAQGPVRGYKDPETGIYSFQSIPYARAPTGKNRFKAPLSPPLWMQPLEAVDRGIVCPQIYGDYLKNKSIQEDCLIVNVHVPDTHEDNLPVVFYVHGGCLQTGYGDMLVPERLIVENTIIAITVNYRVGTHGFLCLGTEDVPGNAGMKDLVAALRWVKKNVANFGGNRDEVTIAGFSAGSAVVDLLMLSKSAEGLFNKVIPESGASIGQWTIQSDPLEKAKLYAKYMNFSDVEDMYALENFYKTVPYELLTSVPFFDNTDSTFGMSPCVERATGDEVFLDKSPVDILKSGEYRKVPLLYGFADMEGLMRAGQFESWKNKMNENFSDFLSADLKFESNEQREQIAKEIKEFYFGSKPVGEDNILGYVDYFSDVEFAYPMLRTVKYHLEAGHNQIYLYEYSFVDENTPVVPHTEVKGATHCAQIVAVNNGLPIIPDLTSNFTEEFVKHAVIIRKIWGNFIKTGAPMVKGLPVDAWPAVGAGWSPHMSLGNEISLRGPLLERRMRFWDDIYSKHYRDPIPPPKPEPRRSEL